MNDFQILKRPGKVNVSELKHQQLTFAMDEVLVLEEGKIYVVGFKDDDVILKSKETYEIFRISNENENTLSSVFMYNNGTVRYFDPMNQEYTNVENQTTPYLYFIGNGVVEVFSV